MTLVREHRGALAESMETVKTVASKQGLCVLINEGLSPWGRHVEPDDVEIKPYAFDERIDWHTRLIIVRDYGVWGMADGDLT